MLSYFNSPKTATDSYVPDRFTILKWAAFAGLSAMLFAQLALLGLSLQASLVLGGAVMTASYAAQRIRYDLKKGFFKEILSTHEKDLASKICVESTKEHWDAIRHGMEGQRSLLNQFESCINPSDWKNSKYYYSGAFLAEINPQVDIKGIELQRKLKVR